MSPFYVRGYKNSVRELVLNDSWVGELNAENELFGFPTQLVFRTKDGPKIEFTGALCLSGGPLSPRNPQSPRGPRS